MDPVESIPLIKGVFHLTYVRNTGAAFGIMPGHRGVFISVVVIVATAIAIYWWRFRPRAIWVIVALSLVLGGALGNMIDRLLAGRVTDFFDPRVFPVFNMADSAIFIGVAMLMLWILLVPDQPPGAEEEIDAADSETNEEGIQDG